MMKKMILMKFLLKRLKIIEKKLEVLKKDFLQSEEERLEKLERLVGVVRLERLERLKNLKIVNH